MANPGAVDEGAHGVRPGVGTAPAEPQVAASVAAALEAASGRPVLLEAQVDGVRGQVHRAGDEVTVSGPFAPADVEAVEAAARAIEADSIVVDVVVAEGGVRFTDLVALNGADWQQRPAGERLAQLAEVAPVAHMVERMAVEVPEWAGAFVEHVRSRGARGVSVRLADAPRGAAGSWLVAEFDA